MDKLPHELVELIFAYTEYDGEDYCNYSKYRYLLVCKLWYHLLTQMKEFQRLKQCKELYVENMIACDTIRDYYIARNRKILRKHFANYNISYDHDAGCIEISMYNYIISISVEVFVDKKCVNYCCRGVWVTHDITRVDDFEKFRSLSYGDSVVEFLTQLNQIPFVHELLALES